MPKSIDLDLRTLSSASRYLETRRSCDALAKGEPLILIDDHDLNPLLSQLQAERLERRSV